MPQVSQPVALVRDPAAVSPKTRDRQPQMPAGAMAPRRREAAERPTCGQLPAVVSLGANRSAGRRAVR
ncbi:MAG: hypothetical protein D6725_16710 [Planctomycetota bacterium]|nr:MAG: hypothetical protein D6725_16710 [Planctomycetota bacterium]